MNIGTPNVTEVPGVSHVSSFVEFYKISAFFIAYILLYIITVPLIMRFGNHSWKLISGLTETLRGKDVTAKKV